MIVLYMFLCTLHVMQRPTESCFLCFLYLTWLYFYFCLYLLTAVEVHRHQQYSWRL